MANFIAEYMAGAIGDAMETVDVNKEWKEKLQDKMPEVAAACVDAICVFLSNNNLQSCEDKTDTVFKPPTYMAEEVKKILETYISSDAAEISRDLLYYVPKPTEPKVIQGGDAVGNAVGSVASAANAANEGIETAKKAATEGIETANKAATEGIETANKAATEGIDTDTNKPELPQILPIPPIPSIDSKIPSIDGKIPPIPPIPSIDSKIPSIDGKIPPIPIPPIPIPGMGDMTGMLKKNEISDGKAETILKKFQSDIESKFKCDESTTNYIKDKIIDTMLRAIRNKLIDTNKNKKTEVKQLLSSIGKETTTQCINKRILLIKPTMELYQKIIAKAPKDILPDYLRKILELFVYSEYRGLLPDTKIQLNTVELSNHIAILKTVDGFEEAKTALKENSIAEIMDLNKLPSPKTEKENTDEEDTDEEDKKTNNQISLENFKQLFEEEKPDKNQAGGRRKNTRKKNKRRHKKRRSTRRYR
jgi:hypothetical protein